MKQVTRIITTMLFLLSFLHSGTAQESTYVRTPGYYTFGINGGLAYQSSDVKATLDGWGVGLTLAKNLYYKPGAPFAFDIRGRALYDQSYGLDHLRSTGILKNEPLEIYLPENGGPGYVYQNHKTHHGELALEGVLSFNELRERTNINLALYGGIGIDWYGTLTDQKDSDGSIYDYDALDISESAGRQSIKTTLNNMYDGRYETQAQGHDGSGNVDFMPAVGVELGYQLTPRFSMGLGHKLTFTRNDDFDGQMWDANNMATNENDLHHYTNLHMRWIIENKKDEIKPPIIEVRNPAYSPYTTRNPREMIRAKIKNINSAMDIDYRVNGRTLGFDFTKGNFNNGLNLRPGKNEIYIRATNAAGYDEETVVIYLEDPGFEEPPVVDNQRRPRVNFINPYGASETVSDERYEIEARVVNVRSRREISLNINNYSITDFDFDSRNDLVRATVRLNPGNNDLMIRVRNGGGSDKDEACVIYKRYEEPTIEPPLVRITSPSNDPHTTDQSRITIKANIQNVDDKLDVTYKVNDRRIRSFDFNGLNFSATANLREGKNTIEITGVNDAGQDSDQTVIFYREEEVIIDPPTVDINRIGQPSIDPFNPNQCNVSLKAVITNIESEDDIRYYLDGSRFYNFTYDKASQTLSSVLTINAGDHDVRIVATNEAGSDEDKADVNSCTGTTDGDKPEVDITTPSRSTSNTTNKSAEIVASVENVDSKSDISFQFNGRKYNNFTYDSRRERVTATVTLKSGNNTVRITGYNQYGQDSDEATIIYKVIENPKLPPTVDITKPRNNSTTQNSSTDLAATVENVASNRDITVKVNGRTTSGFKYDSRSRKLSAKVNLKEGKNTIEVTATNKDGSDSDQVTITYKKIIVPKNPPTVDITSPKNNSATTSSKTDVTATIRNIESKQDITLKVNGRATTNFSFDSRRKKLTASVNLKEGNNTIVVTATNRDGSDEDKVTVNYKKIVVPKNPPTVDITTPKNNSATQSSKTDVAATIKNVESKQDISLKVNGRATTNFKFDSRRKKLTASVNLKEGNNTIVVTATNRDGSDEDKVTVIYKKIVVPKNPPTVKITKPKNNSVSKTVKADVEASITNVSSKNDITFMVNGRKTTSFSWDGRKNKLRASVNLIDGINNIEVTAKNRDGSDNDRIKVRYTKPKPAPKPTVDITSPRNGSKQTRNKAQVKATIKNVTSKSDITFRLNGRKTTNFTFNAKRKLLTATISLNEGNNSINIEASNETGKASDEVRVSYQPIVKAPAKISAFSVSQPSVDPFDPDKAKCTVKATLENVTSKKSITITLNGKKVRDFTYDPRTRKVNAVLNITSGTSNIVLKVSNKDGNDQRSDSVSF